MSADGYTTLLPGGYIDTTGAIHREVVLRQLTGREEEIIADPVYQENTAQIVTAILANCIRRIGTITEINRDMALQLLGGDRDFLILQLYRVTFGNTIERVMICPNGECGQKMDVDIDIGEIEVKSQENLRPLYEFDLSDTALIRANGQIHQHVIFRLPNGSDQEAIFDLLKINEAKAYTRLYARCIQQIGEIRQINDEIIRDASMQARREISDRMNKLAPGPNLALSVNCPACNQFIQIPFEIPGFFLTSYQTT